MWFKVKINSNLIIQQQKEVAKNKLNTFTDEVLEKVNEYTPEKEWELLENNKRSEVIDMWDKLYSRVYNESEHAKPVEYWVWWKTYNYHKPKWQKFYEWIWAWMYGRATLEMENKFNEVTK